MPSEVTPATKRRGLLVRLTVAPLVLATALALLFWHDRTGWSAPSDTMIVLLGAGAAWECATMLRAGGMRASRPLATVASALLAGLALLYPHDARMPAFARALVLALVVVA